MADLEIERRDGILSVTLSRPESRNAVTLSMWDGLARVFTEAATDPDVRVVLLTGAGGNFSSGADIGGNVVSSGSERVVAAGSDFESSSLELMRQRIAPAALALHRLDKPSVAMVQGIAAGGACNLALGCDLVYASEDARFSQIFVRRALSLDMGGSWLLPRLVGLQKAKELALFGDFIGARDALAAGLIAGVEANDVLEERVRDRLNRLASQSPGVMASIKRALEDSLELSFADALDREFVLQARCMASDDFAEGIAAFLEKRAPRFGRPRRPSA